MAARRTSVRVMGSGLLLLLLVGRIYGALIPWGASPVPFCLASVRGPELSSPDGSRRLDVYFNDAGAAHSGNHWTWLVEHHWIIGHVVVSQGYLGADVVVDREEIPVTWGPDNELTVSFRKSRHDR